MEMLPLLIIASVWLFIAFMFSTLKKSAKNAGQKRGPRTGPSAPAGPSPAETAERAPGLRPEGLRSERLHSERDHSERLRPTVEAFRHDDSLYSGSLNAETGEGYDPCHDEQLAPLSRLEAEPEVQAVPDAPRLRLSWSSNEIVQGVIMSEILNRKRL